MNEHVPPAEVQPEGLQTISPPEAVGHMVGLCAFSGHYLNWTISDIGRLFIPPVMLGQCKFWFNEGRLTAFATWAYLSDECDERIRTTFADPDDQAWNSGRKLWIIDLVAPYGNVMEVVKDLQKTAFINQTEPGFALRRDKTGKVRKIAKWAHWQAVLEKAGGSLER
jgi:cytolysin-activating lysine-acyltransferase